MGKNYYCEYCDKRLKNDAQVIKKHIAGLAHTAARNEHYTKFKDPQTILTEESPKAPCQRYFRGECKFGGNCRFSHYTPEELSNLQCEVNTNAYMKWYQEQPKSIDENRLASFLSRPEKCDPEIRQLSQIWNYPDELVAGVYDLPKSLHKLDPNRIPNELSEWG
ncbi:zinc finger matrin-type protein 5 [Bradysia coprophila]|uniref:zinc finger matrin-type protein 5 n=1 Tax=Bradysia coprophila TaxID=38358 RepID=UPI00187DBCED|nr:zinc finger matrin-type protein 5 [Bradysia coprophila]